MLKHCNTFKVLQHVLQNFKSIAISIAKFQKYCKISKVLQYFESIAILIAKSQSIAISIVILCNTIGTTPAHPVYSLQTNDHAFFCILTRQNHRLNH